MRKRIFKILLLVFFGVLIFISGLFIYVFSVIRIEPPNPGNLECLNGQRTQPDTNLFVLGNNWLRKSESGLYEMYLEGKPFERGVAFGKLAKELSQHQENVFVEQIHKLVPSSFKLNFLKYFVGWFNRNLDKNIPEEFKLEIFGLSTESSHDYDNMAPAYQRILNYHAAHDIGHALQNMSLVGCTSWATWYQKTDDEDLLVARNFDFYVGDEFALNKIVAFYKPESGHRFMMVTFGGMVGALSGMNDHGLTVTINAAKSEIPTSSAMPVSLVAREILQYASTIEEAYAIAAKRKIFVSESFLIGSAQDGIAAIIEKTPEATELVTSQADFLVCTNHFQSSGLGGTTLNQEHMRTSASLYRWQHVHELLDSSGKISVGDAVAILRNQKGLQGKSIGLGNEKAINQLVAHHAVIFQPAQLKVWVSTSPWQIGKFVCYDLHTIFDSVPDIHKEIYDSLLVIPDDPFLDSKSYRDFIKFAQYRFPFNSRQNLQPDSLVKWNPDSYLSYMLAGDACFMKEDFKQASFFYEKGLTKEIATVQERDYIVRQLKSCKKSLK